MFFLGKQADDKHKFSNFPVTFFAAIPEPTEKQKWLTDFSPLCHTSNNGVPISRYGTVSYKTKLANILEHKWNYIYIVPTVNVGVTSNKWKEHSHKILLSDIPFPDPLIPYKYCNNPPWLTVEGIHYWKCVEMDSDKDSWERNKFFYDIPKDPILTVCKNIAGILKIYE